MIHGERNCLLIERTTKGFKPPEPSQKQLSLFGYGGALLSGGLAIYLAGLSSPWELPLAALCALLLVMTLFSRGALVRAYRLWALFGMALGWLNLRLLVAALLYVVFTPIRFVQNLAGRDPLNRKFDKERSTYLHARKPLRSNHYEKMY